MKRREFLGVTLAGMGSLAASCGGGGGSAGGTMSGPPPASGAALAQGQPLRPLAVLANTSGIAGQF